MSGAGDDTLNGGGGNDVIEGGLGTNTIIGGSGNNTASYEHLSDAIPFATVGVTVDLAAGTAIGPTLIFLPILNDTFTDIQNVVGSALNDLLTGDANANMLSGGGGKDYLEGGGGNDTLVGGAGNDAYILRVGDDQDTIVEASNGGVDTVRSAVTITALAANVERVQLVGKANLNATGNELTNVIAGNTADNHIDGAAGRDVLTGFGGNDTFVFTSFGAANVDRITDFNLNDATHHDAIALDRSVFAAVGFNQDGTLADGEFAVIDSTHKPTADAHLFYNTDNGALYYDADGYGGHMFAAAQVAVFEGKPLLTTDDIHALIS